MNDHYYLHAAHPDAADAQPAVTLGHGYPKQVNGIEAFYFWRKSAKDGDYVHPIKQWRLSITAERRRRWAEAFRQLKANGVKVPIIEDHKEEADKTLGYVVDVRNAGDWYEELHQYLGADKRDKALRNGVSVGIHPAFKDGQGRSYGEAIFHSAITPGPVVPGAGDATPIAASRGQHGGVELFELAAPPNERTTAMKWDITEAQMTTLKPLLGDGVTDANIGQKILDKLSSTCELSRTQGEKITTLEGKVTTLTSEKGALDTKVLELSRGTKPEISAETLDVLVEGAEIGLDKLVADNCISPAVKEKLHKALIKGEDGKPNTLMLSRTHSGTPVSISRAVIDALKENKVVTTGRQAGIQTHELSRSKPGEQPKGEQSAEEIKARAEKIGGGKQAAMTM